MNIAGIGPLELLVIAVVALLVLGPARMVQAARGAGKAIRRVQRELREVDPRRLLEEALNEAAQDVRRTVDLDGPDKAEDGPGVPRTHRRGEGSAGPQEPAP